MGHYNITVYILENERADSRLSRSKGAGGYRQRLRREATSGSSELGFVLGSVSDSVLRSVVGSVSAPCWLRVGSVSGSLWGPTSGSVQGWVWCWDGS